MGQDQLDKLIREKLGQHETPIDPDQLWNNISDKTAEDIDPIIKDKLYMHETPVDNQLLWSKINPHIESTRSYKPLLITAISIIAIAVLSYIILHNSKLDNTVSIVNISQQTESKQQESIKEEVSILSTVDSKTEIDKEAVTSRNIEAETVVKESIIDDRSTANALGSMKSADRNKTTSTNNGEYVNQSMSPTNVNSSSKETQEVKNDVASVNNTLASKESSDISKSQSLGTSMATVSDLSLIQATQSLSNYTTRSAESYISGLPKKDICFRKNKSVECYDYRPKKMHYSVLAYTTADYYMKSLSPIDETPTSYLADRKRTQKAQVSNRTGLQLKLRHKSGIYLKLGAEIGFLRERFSHETRDTTTEILPNQLLNIDIDSNGDTTHTYGNAPVTTISSKTWKVNNSLRTIGIPVLVGYQNTFNKLNIGFELGVLYNINHTFEGWLLGPASDPIEVQDYFINSNDLNLTGGININYELSDRYNAFIMSSFRQNVNNINQRSTNLIDQKNTTLGIGIGIEMKL